MALIIDTLGGHEKLEPAWMQDEQQDHAQTCTYSILLPPSPFWTQSTASMYNDKQVQTRVQNVFKGKRTCQVKCVLEFRQKYTWVLEKISIQALYYKNWYHYFIF